MPIDVTQRRAPGIAWTIKAALIFTTAVLASLTGCQSQDHLDLANQLPPDYFFIRPETLPSSPHGQFLIFEICEYDLRKTPDLEREFLEAMPATVDSKPSDPNRKVFVEKAMALDTKKQNAMIATLNQRAPRHIVVHHEFPRWVGKYFQSRTILEDSELTLEFTDVNSKPDVLFTQMDFVHTRHGFGWVETGNPKLPPGTREFVDASPSVTQIGTTLCLKEGDGLVLGGLPTFSNHIISMVTVRLVPAMVVDKAVTQSK